MNIYYPVKTTLALSSFKMFLPHYCLQCRHAESPESSEVYSWEGGWIGFARIWQPTFLHIRIFNICQDMATYVSAYQDIQYLPGYGNILFCISGYSIFDRIWQHTFLHIRIFIMAGQPCFFFQFQTYFSF